MIIAILGATKIFAIAVEGLKKRISNKPIVKQVTAMNLYEISSILLVIVILTISSFFMVAGTNNAFIYFKF
jgi:uncharacterized membrane protein